MLNVGTDAVNDFLSSSPESTASLTVTNGSMSAVLGPESIKSVSWTWKACDGQFSYGSCIACEAEMSILSSALPSGLIEDGAHIVIDIVYQSRKVHACSVYVDDSMTAKDGLFTTIKAFDLMYGKEMQKVCPRTGTEPTATIGDAKNVAAAASGVYIAAPPALNGDLGDSKMLVGSEGSDSEQTCRDVVSRIALSSATCARATVRKDGTDWVRFFRLYDKVGASVAVKLSGKHVMNGGFQWDGRDSSHIGRYMTNTASETGAVTTYFYYPQSPDKSKTYMEIDSAAFSNVRYFNEWAKRVAPCEMDYRGFSLDCVGVPFIEPFDKVEYTDIDGSTSTLYPFSTTHTYNGAWSTSMTASPMDATYPKSDSSETSTEDTSASAKYGQVIGAENLLVEPLKMHEKAIRDSSGSKNLDSTILGAIASMYEDPTMFGATPPYIDTLSNPEAVAVFNSGSANCLSAAQEGRYKYINSPEVTRLSETCSPLYFQKSGEYAAGDIVVLCKAVLLEPFSDGKFKTYTFSHYWNKGTTEPSELVTGKNVQAKWHVAIGNAGQIDASKQIDWWELSPIRVSSKYRSDSSNIAGKSGEYMRDSYTFEFLPDSIPLEGGYPLAIVMWAEWGSDTDTLSTGCWQLEEGTCCSTLTSQFLYSPDFKGTPTAPKFIGNLEGNADTATEIKEKAGVNASLEKLSTWTANPKDSTQLIRRDTGNTATYGRVTFLTVWNYIKGKADSLYAKKASPVFTGNPTAPTPSFGDSSKSLATTEFVAAAITGAITPTDYIVAYGKCDFWTWRMWASGVAECWGSTGATHEDVSSEWGSLYEGSAHSNGFPGNTSESPALAFSVKLGGVTYKKLFVSTPDFCSCSFNPTGGAGISGIEIGGGLSATKTPTVFLLRPTSAGVDGHYSYYAKGRWK